MDPAHHQALDRLVSQGETNVAAKDFAGAGKTGTALAVALAAAGHIEQSGRGKFSLTAAGREAWLVGLTEAQRAAHEAERRGRADKAVRELLGKIDTQGGKAFTAAEFKKLSADSLRRALERGLIVEGDKPRVYTLTDAGRVERLGSAPPSEQIAGLRAFAGEIGQRWASAKQSFQKSGPPDLAAVRDELVRRADEAAQAFAAALEEVRGFALLAEAAERLQARVAEEVRLALESLSPRDDGGAAARLEQIDAKHTAMAEALTRRADALERELREARPATPAPAPAAPPASAPTPARPDAEALWAETVRAHAEIKSELARVAGSVTVPALTDKIRDRFAGVSAVDYHTLLQQWAADDRLTLQLCNLPQSQPRAAEGIQSPRGLLFFVVLR